MGHAGAWAAPGEPSAKEKWQALENAGVTMVDHPGKFGKTMKALLSKRAPSQTHSTSNTASQLRGYHTMRRPTVQTSSTSDHQQPFRSLHLRADQAATLLKEYDISTSLSVPSDGHLVAITIARTQRSPCIVVVPHGDLSKALHIPFPYKEGPLSEQIAPAAAHLGLQSDTQLASLIASLWGLYVDKEAISLSITLSADGAEQSNPNFVFDDAAFRSTQRHSELHAQRDTSLLDPSELAGEEFGLVYIPVNLGEGPFIGTLVNGAGLAMNTIDSLAAHNLSVTNFLDTGGKATSATVKESLRLVLKDDRVKTVFVNIFGGLTKCDMIAEGVLAAMEELQPDVPVVVRLRGTREKEAEAVMAKARDGMKVYCEPDFEKSVELVKQLVNGEGPTVKEWLTRSRV
jgi:succinyl-CoA synthetase alpha subunit